MKAVLATFLVFLLAGCAQTPSADDGPATGGGPDADAPVPDYVGSAGEDSVPMDSPDVPPLGTES